MADVIAAVATGKIPCAIGILRLSGDGCAEVCNKVFRAQSGKPLTDAPNRKLIMGELMDEQGRVINRKWLNAPHALTISQGLKLAIGYAF